MKFIDLGRQYATIQAAVDARIRAVMSHGQYIMGPEVALLEERLANFVGVKHCVTACSGTMALQLALMSLEIGADDEVITTPFSFFATVETILLLGAKPVFVDIDPATYNINPVLIEAAITPRTKVILPVSLYGQCADFTQINAIARRHKLVVLEDAAQSFGASQRGVRSCALSPIACTSFFPSKPLGCYGDGGACFTDDDQLAHRLRLLRHHGEESRYSHKIIGTNARFDTLQAAILLAKLDIFQEEVQRRQTVASWYHRRLAGHIDVPYIAPDNVSVFAQYSVQVNHRDQVQAALAQQGIPTAVHYPKPLYAQPAMTTQVFSQPLPCPETERAARRVMSLPFHPYLEEVAVERVCEILSDLVGSDRQASSTV